MHELKNSFTEIDKKLTLIDLEYISAVNEFIVPEIISTTQEIHYKNKKIKELDNYYASLLTEYKKKLRATALKERAYVDSVFDKCNYYESDLPLDPDKVNLIKAMERSARVLFSGFGDTRDSKVDTKVSFFKSSSIFGDSQATFSDRCNPPQNHIKQQPRY